jgi:sigma-B regulation protein RsbU (phosphoserine phosphatase)
MASIQSILRTLLTSGLAHDGGADARFSTAHAVEQLNRQLYANTAPEKYATFFFGVYEEATRMLKYTNAGHLPPLLVQANGSAVLESTGTVVGLFPSVRYEERHIEIAAGDVLVAYTDGITEAEDSYGVEFGTERLAEIVTRNRHVPVDELVRTIFDAVALWSRAPEQADDMTLLLARGI